MNAAEYTNYYREFNSIAKHRRNATGTACLSVVTVVGVFLFIFRYWKVLCGMKCDWVVLDVFLVPPLQFIIYAMMIYETPDKHVDGLCLFGRISVLASSFIYCLFMLAMSVKNESLLELIFYLLLTAVQITMLLPDTFPPARVFRPFLKRPETEIEAEQFEIIRRYEGPKSSCDFGTTP